MRNAITGGPHRRNKRRDLTRYAMQHMAAMGRGPDTQVAHVAPGDVVVSGSQMTPELYSALGKAGVLDDRDRIVGYGNINPNTGLEEFQLRDSQRDAYREYGESRRAGERQSRTGRESGDRGRTGGMSQPQVQSYRQYGESRAAAERFPDRPAEDWARDPDTGAWGSYEDVDLSPVVDLLPTPIPQLMDLANVDLTVQEFNPAVPEMHGGAYGGGARSPNVGPESRGGKSMQGMSGQRAAREQSFARPPAPMTPESLGLGLGGLTPLQMRSKIATQAVAGWGGEFRSPQAVDFYTTLLQRHLIGESGELAGLDTLLPIDMQFLAQIMGIENPADTAALLTALQQ